MSDFDLDEAERLCAAATPGPWTVTTKPAHTIVYVEGGGLIADVFHADDDARFIAYARTFVPAAVARIRELEAAIRGALPGIDTNDPKSLRAYLALDAALRGGR